MDLYFTSSQAVSTRQPLFYRSLLKGILLTLAISFCQVQYLAAQTNIVANGTFDTDLSGWTVAGQLQWVNVPSFGGSAAYVSNNYSTANFFLSGFTEVLSQNLTGLNYGPVPNHVTIKFDLKSGNANGSAAVNDYAYLYVYLDGQYAGWVGNLQTDNTLRSTAYGAATITYTPNPYNFENDVSSPTNPYTTVTVDFPWISKPNTAALSFAFAGHADDLIIDNISVLSTCGAPAITATNPTCAVTTGSIAVTAPAGGASYTLTPGGTVSSTGSFPGLAPSTGPYTVSYTAPGCTTPPASNAVSIGAPATGCAPTCAPAAGTISRQ